jgi:2-oxoglutarate ferredoxin oxidoreductase subunit alpha
MKVKMTEKRMKKLNNFFEKEGYFGYEIINSNAKKMIITTSFTSYTAKEFVKNNPEYGLIIIKFLKPLDHRLVSELKNVEEITFLEHNFSGQLENYMTKELKLDTLDLEIKHYRKYDLYPFYIEDLEEFFK